MSTGRQKQSVHVVVTADDIGNGNRCDPWGCPVARALWRATGAKWAVYTNYAYQIGKRIVNCKDTAVALPDVASSFVRDYDNLCYPEPMEFDMDISIAMGVDAEVEAKV